MKQALGLVEIQGLSTAVVAADNMAKAANIRILEIENAKGRGYMTIKVAGDVGAVNAAVNAGRQIGIENQKLVSWKVIPRPSDDVERAFCGCAPPDADPPSGKMKAGSQTREDKEQKGTVETEKSRDAEQKAAVQEKLAKAETPGKEKPSKAKTAAKAKQDKTQAMVQSEMPERKAGAQTGTTEAKEKAQAGTTEAKEKAQAGTAETKEKAQAGTAETKEKAQAGTAEAKEKAQAGTAEAKEKAQVGTAEAKEPDSSEANAPGKPDGSMSRRNPASAGNGSDQKSTERKK